MLPNARLMARAFHRVPVSPLPSSTVKATRAITSSATHLKWTGSTPDDHIANEADTHEIQHDAAREGKQERAKGQAENAKGEHPGEGGSAGGGSSAATEKSGSANRKTKEEFPEAPDTIGMQDERGGKGQ